MRYLFLCAWVEGSDSAFDNDNGYNGVHGPDDLLPRFQAGQDDIFSVIVEGAPNENLAATYGYEKAFHANYTGYDTVSIIIPLTDESLLKSAVNCTVIADLKETP